MKISLNDTMKDYCSKLLKSKTFSSMTLLPWGEKTSRIWHFILLTFSVRERSFNIPFIGQKCTFFRIILFNIIDCIKAKIFNFIFCTIWRLTFGVII